MLEFRIIASTNESLSFVKKKAKHTVQSIATVIRETFYFRIIITCVCLEQSSSYIIMQFLQTTVYYTFAASFYHIKSSPCLTLLSVSDLIYTSHGFYFVSWITVNNSVVCMILLTNHCIVSHIVRTQYFCCKQPSFCQGLFRNFSILFRITRLSYQ